MRESLRSRNSAGCAVVSYEGIGGPNVLLIDVLQQWFVGYSLASCPAAARSLCPTLAPDARD
jgi:hypothetical protein